MKVAKIIQLWNRIRSGLIETIGKFPDEELDYVAVDDGYSVRQIILHIAQEEYGEIQYGLARHIAEFPAPYPEAEYPTIDSLEALLAAVHAQTARFLESLSDEELESEFQAQWGDTRPLLDFVAHVMEHEVHHRGELSLILGLLGHEGLDA